MAAWYIGAIINVVSCTAFVSSVVSVVNTLFSKISSTSAARNDCCSQILRPLLLSIGSVYE